MLTLNDIDDAADRARFMMEMQAAVAWPTDPAARRRFLCVAGALMADWEADIIAAAEDPAEARESELHKAVWEQLYQDNGGRRELAQAPSAAEVLFRRFHNAMSDALLAGRVLTFCCMLHREGGLHGDASIRKAKEIVHKHVPADVAAALGIPRSHQPVNEAWASHRCVAHLAAGMMNTPAIMNRDAFYNGLPGGPSIFTVFLGRQDLIDFLGMAATAQKLGSEIIPHARQEPILPADQIIRIAPGIEPYSEEEVEFLGLPEGVAASLHSAVLGKKKGGLGRR